MFAFIKNMFKLPSLGPELEKSLAEFFDDLLSGKKLVQYADDRRFPLDLLFSSWRAALISNDPKIRDVVRSPSNFHSKAEILISDWPEDDSSLLALRPARHKPWHDHPIVLRLFPPHKPNPVYLFEDDDGDVRHLPPSIGRWLRDCRTGRQPVFAGNHHVEPEIFDHPFALNLFLEKDQKKGRTKVRTRWRRSVTGQIQIPATDSYRKLETDMDELARQLIPEITIFE